MRGTYFRGSFTTAKIPYGRVYPNNPITHLPSLGRRSERISDPVTGARVQLLTESTDFLPSSKVKDPIQAGWPESGSTEVCHPQVVRRNQADGYYCLVPTTLNRLLYWIPAGEGDAELLGELPSSAAIFNFSRTVYSNQVNWDPNDPNAWYGAVANQEGTSRVFRMVRWQYRPNATPAFVVSLVTGPEGNLTELSGGVLHPDLIQLDLARGESAGGASRGKAGSPPYMVWSFGNRDVCGKPWYVALYFPATTNPSAPASMKLIGVDPIKRVSQPSTLPLTKLLHYVEPIPGTGVLSLVLNEGRQSGSDCNFSYSPVPGWYWNHENGDLVNPDPNPPTGGHNIFRQAGQSDFDGLFLTASATRFDGPELPGNHVWDIWNTLDGKQGSAGRRAIVELNPKFADQRGHCFPNWCQSHPSVVTKLGDGPGAGLDNIPFVGYQVASDIRRPLFPARANSTLHFVGFRKVDASKMPIAAMWGVWPLRTVLQIQDGQAGYFTMCRYWGGSGACGLTEAERDGQPELSWGDLIVNVPVPSREALPACLETLHGILPTKDFCVFRLAPAMQQVMEIGLEPPAPQNPWKFVRPISSNLIPLRLDGGFLNARYSPNGKWVLTAGATKQPVQWPAEADLDDVEALGPTNGRIVSVPSADLPQMAGVQFLVQQPVVEGELRIGVVRPTDAAGAPPRLSATLRSDQTVQFHLNGQRVCADKVIPYRPGDTITLVNRAPSYVRRASVNDETVCTYQFISGSPGTASANFSETDVFRIVAEVPAQTRVSVQVDNSSPIYMIKMPTRDLAGEPDSRYTDLADFTPPWDGTLRYGYAEFDPVLTPLPSEGEKLSCMQGRDCLLRDVTRETIWPLIPGRVVWLAREKGKALCAFVSRPDDPGRGAAACGASATANGDGEESVPEVAVPEVAVQEK